MPVNQLTNPLAEEGESASYGHHEIEIVYDSAASGNLLNGNVVVIEPTNIPFVIKKNTTTPDGFLLGVVVGAPTGGYTPGSVVQVLTYGIMQVLFDANNTTAGHFAIQSSTTAGTATDSATATVARTLGVILQTVTISSGTALVWVLVKEM